MTHKKDFSPNEEVTNQSPLEENVQKQPDLSADEPKRQILKIVLVGSPEVVRGAILYSYLTGQVEVGDWSRMTPHPSNPEEVMSMLSRKVRVNNNTTE